MDKRQLLLKALIGLVLIALIAGGFWLGALKHEEECRLCQLKEINPQVVRHYIASFGSWAIVVYVILYTVNTVTLIPPIALMSLSAGALFGPIWGTVALTLGAFSGTTTTFVMSRFIGGKFVDKFVKGKGAEFNEKLSQNGFLFLLPIRLIGFPPYEFVNYASGLSKIRYKDYISATMLGMSPAIIIQVLLADRVTNLDPRDPLLWLAVGAFIAMIVITGHLIKKQKAKDPIQNKV